MDTVRLPHNGVPSRIVIGEHENIGTARRLVFAETIEV
jgi:hypothetical protein